MTDRLSDAEPLMWRLEQDPALQSTFGALSVLDGPVDHDRLTLRLRRAVARIPLLRSCIVERPGQRPQWAVDRHFDLDHHLRFVGLRPGSDRADLLDLAARLVADPFDRTRPLWQFIVLESDDQWALLTKLHHSVSDGEGGVALALEYMEFSAEGDGPVDEVDLDGLIADEASRQANDLSGLGDALRASAGDRLGRIKAGLGEAAMYAADPPRIVEQGAALFDGMKAGADQLAGQPDPSPLWRQRGRRRHLHHFGGELAPLLAGAKALGGTLNDALLTAVAEAASRLHEGADPAIDAIPASFIVSTRAPDDHGAAGGNAFTPAPTALPIQPLPLDQRFASVVGQTTAAKQRHTKVPALLDTLAGPARLLPVAALTALARQQSSRLDIATSNLRSSPIPVWVAGARIVENCPIGPLGGTAANITLLSYADRYDIGAHLDGDAFGSPEQAARFAAEMCEALERLAAFG